MGVCYILVNQPFLSFMSCFHTIRFSYEGCTIYVHYYSSLLNGSIHTNIHIFIHVIHPLFFSLVFLCMLVRIFSSKIYFLCFFLASLHIALIYYFYMVSELQGWSICFYRVEECFQSPIPLWRRASRFSPSLFCRLQRVSLRVYQQLQYGFKISSTISFQLCWLEAKDECILEEAMSLWCLHWCIEWTWVLWREDWLAK